MNFFFLKVLSVFGKEMNIVVVIYITHLAEACNLATFLKRTKSVSSTN